MGKLNQRVVTLLLYGSILAAAFLIPLPSHGKLLGLPTVCPLKTLSGYPCPACGLTRSFVLFAHGYWREAFVYHPLGPLFFLVLCAGFVRGLINLKRRPEVLPSSSRLSTYTGAGIIAALIIVWIVRMSGIVPFPANF